MQLKLIRDLRNAGRLHGRLLGRIRILGMISIILLGISLYEAVRYGASIGIYAALIVVGFVLGVTLFSKMNRIVWNEEQEVISTGRMDMAGFIIVLLYIGFEIGLRTFLKTEFAGTLAITSYLLATVGASLLGRTVGTLRAIQQLAHKA